MAKSKSRTISTEAMSGISNIPMHQYNDQAGAQKVLGPIIGALKRLPDAVTAQELDHGGKIIAVYNNSASVAWLTSADKKANVVAPTSVNGIALRPNDYTHVALGADRAFQVSASTAICYEVIDDTFID